MATKYDVTVQYTDTSRDPGYQETRADLVVEAEDTDDAFERARTAKPNVSSVQIQGIHGAAVAFDGASWHRYYR